jgi:surface carbohydrate biosynthesis protein
VTRKFYWLKCIPYQKTDILIIDKYGYDLLKECLPSQANHIIIPNGSIILVAKLKYFLLIALNILKGETRFSSMYATLVKTLDPNVIISFNDNNAFLGKLQEKFPDKLVIAVQNGVRVGLDLCIGSWRVNTAIPHYYGFGDYEKDLMKERKLRICEYVKVGSLKLGLVLSSQNINNKFVHDICFISQFHYKRELEIMKRVEPIYKTQRLLFDIIYNICLVNNYSLVVAMVKGIHDDDYERELDYYKSEREASNIKLVPNDRKGITSYNTGFSSRLVVSLWSTLSFELFGCGQRTLFSGLLHNPDKQYYKELLKNMPSDLLLYEMEENHFQGKIEALLNMTDKEYLEKTAFSRSYYMRCERPYPHEMIKERIAEHLNIPVE